VFTEEEERRNNFRWSIDGGRVYGPGTNDVKGGTVIMYMMLDAIASVAPELFERVRWELLFDAAEEAESDDFGSLCVNGLGGRALACLVFEGGERDKNGYSIVTSRKGRAVLRVTTRGRSAHAGVDHQSGASAITQMADVVREISGFTDYEKEITFNVGTVTGGTVLNRVPHECTAEVEMRAFSPDALAEGVARIRSLEGFSSVTSGDGRYRCSTSVELLRDNPAWPRNPATEGLFRFWMDAAGMLGTRVKSEARGGISDGNHTWDHVPTIDGLGPSGDNAHCSERLANGSKSQEYAILPSFIPKALLNAAAVSLMIRESLQR
jgi:glutamate carboxypeptidase